MISERLSIKIWKKKTIEDHILFKNIVTAPRVCYRQQNEWR